MSQNQDNPQTTPDQNAPSPDQNSQTSSTPSDSGSTDLGSDPVPGDLGSDGEVALGTEGEKKADEQTPPEYFGTLEEGQDYEPFTLPEGSVADPELQTSFASLAKKLQLNQKGAQELVNYKTELDQAQIKAWGNHLTELRQKAQADPVIGGAKYNESVSLGRQVIAKFGGADGGAELRAVMKNYGVGAHPAMIRFMAAIGRAVGETPTGGNAGSGGSVEKPLHELFYGDSKP